MWLKQIIKPKEHFKGLAGKKNINCKKLIIIKMSAVKIGGS